jgi:hypothetical protein
MTRLCSSAVPQPGLFWTAGDRAVILAAANWTGRETAMTPVKIALGTVVALVALIAALSLAYVGPLTGGGDQCAKPVSERTGAWVCHEPDGGRPARGR